MKGLETIAVDPIQTDQTQRPDDIRVLTSCDPGKIVPVAYVPLLREDRVSSGRIRLKLDMQETVRPLLNAINVTAYVHFVPFLALDNVFDGLEQFNRSYMNQPEPRGAATPVPFFRTATFQGSQEFWKTLGVHWYEGAPINAAPLEAYNTLVNFRRRARSERLAQRTLLDSTLAPAFWKDSLAYSVVPDFDAAMIDGEVPLSFLSDRAPISGIGISGGDATAVLAGHSVRDSAGITPYAKSIQADATQSAVNVRVTDASTTHANAVPAIFAELAQAGITVSLSNIEVMKRTAAFARLREQFDGIDDDGSIDLLMQGIRVPEVAMKQPILLDRKSTIFGYSERHAMDGANLAKSVTTGLTQLDLSFRTPPMNTGGIVLVTLEIVPEQLFERQEDLFLGITATDSLPDFTRDFLDPEKVEAVANKFVDVRHASPAAIFGYAPLNHRWKRRLTRVGGKFKRPDADTFVEDRQRLWTVEQLNPVLTSDFYLCPPIHKKVFADQVAHPFEVLATGLVQIVGNTQFGAELEEDGGNYDAVVEKVDVTRIQQ